MSEAVILKNGKIVKASNFGDIANISFDYLGGVKSFTYQDVKYIDLYNIQTGIFSRYAQSVEFDKLDKDGDRQVTVDEKLLSIEFTFYDKLVEAEVGDVIVDYLIDKNENPTSDTICYKLYQWVYTLPYNGPINEVIYSTPRTFCKTLTNNKASEFQSNYLDYSLLGGGTIDNRLVKEISVLIESIDEEIFAVFDGFVSAGLDQGIFHFYENSAGSLSLYDFENYKKGLESWLSIFKKHRAGLSQYKDNAERLYIIAFSLMKYNMLEALTDDEKIDMLKVFAKGTITGYWTKAFAETQYSEELIVVGIVKSVTLAQNNCFLEKLILPDDNGETIFEALYRKINGDNKKDLLNVLLNKWTVSKYNPYLSNGDLDESRLSQYTYNDKAPYTLGYRSSEFLGIYANNFNFKFEKNKGKIIAKERIFEVNPNPYSQSAGHWKDKKFGTYTIYQPISLADHDFETTVKLPVLGGQVNSLIPIFYLKYVDDTNDWESFKLGVGLFLDIALTFSGIGNLAKLRHLRHMPRIAQVAAVLGAADITVATADLMFKYNCSSDPEFCSRFQNYLLCLQLITGGTDIVLNYALTKSARRLKEIEADYPSNFNQEFRDVINAHAAKTLDDLADFIASTRKNILNKIEQKASQFSKTHFTNQQIDELIEYALDLRMNPAEIEGFIITATKYSPKDKTILFNALKDQMDNWKNTIEVRGYPYKFSDDIQIGVQQFTTFKNKLRTLLDDFNLPTDDIRIGGSSVRNPNAGDIDCYIFMTREQANAYTERIKVFSQKFAKDAKERNYYKNGWSKPFNEDKIIYKNYIVNETNGEKILDEAYARGLLNDTSFPADDRFNAFEITIIIKDEALELYPYLKLNL